MLYVFTFFGEFGYELLNWQGVIRKFSKTISPSDRIICCSRANLAPWYESCAHYIDITEFSLFQNSQASCYYAIIPGSNDHNSQENRTFDRKLRAEAKQYVAQRIPESLRPKGFLGQRRIRYIFSSQLFEMNGCRLGCNREQFAVGGEGDIYDRLDLGNNEYSKIKPDLSKSADIESRIGFSLKEPYILVQSRTRDVVIKSDTEVPKENLIRKLAETTRVVLLAFSTGRKNDSYSRFKDSPGATIFECRSFVEQACLIHFARKCVFFTEGDFGSHIYVPPFLGKNVLAIAPSSIYKLETTPIDFWNRNVFRFGGQIIPRISEEVFESESSQLEVVDEAIAS